MRARLIFICAIFLLINQKSLYGQTGCRCRYEDKSNPETRLSGELLETLFDTITYFNKDWLPGDIFLADGETIRNIRIKYNALLDELFWLEPESGKTIKLDKEAILQFHFLNFHGDTSVYFKKITVKRYALADSSEIFGQEIYNGKLSLYILHTFYIQRREIVPTVTGYYQKAIYEEEPVYYLRFLNDKAVGFKNLNRKNIISIVPDKKDQIKQFFKQTKLIRIETYRDLIMLMKFLNSIADL